MRQLQQGPVLKVRAIGGLHVVTLAWDFVAGQEEKRQGLLGFAIERSELKNGEVLERYFIRGIKRFRFKDEGLAPGTPMPTSEHPIQTFQWGDYTTKPKTTYRYKVVPVYGKPKLLRLDEDSATTVRIVTEDEFGPGSGGGGARHDIFFNRGVAGSQAFARKFGREVLDEDKPDSKPMVWLSRDLFEELIEFIGHAKSKDYKLRAMLYEFRYLPVGLAFKQAARAKADVDIRYEAKSYKKHNEEMIKAAAIKRLCKPQKSRAGIRHNKFIILIYNDEPIAVWTGSTNISAGGIFGHSNVGHVVWDKDIARRYLDYWELLAAPDVTTSRLKTANLAVEPTPARHSLPPKGRTLTLFSPRDTKGDEATLHWYADLIGGAKRIACITYAFNLDEFFHDVLMKQDNTLRYALFDKSPGKKFEDDVVRFRNTVIAPGAKLEKDSLENFLGEKLSGFNKNLYVHDKFILVDPLGDDPIVVTGTANFSRPSQHSNDENMLVIRGDTRVADIYFGEFMRIFDHFYSRYVVKRIREAETKKAKKADPNAGFLEEDWQKWVPKHFEAGPKSLRRRYFMGE